ncbi:MAG: VCBS repeat-containing protein [Bacteroidota bacterium]
MSTKLLLLAVLFVSIINWSCKSSNTGAPALFELKDGTGIDFINHVTDTKDLNVLTYRNFYNGGGVAIGDIDNDGLPDVFFTANMGSNKLYKNKGNFQFEDISARAGFIEKKDWSTGVVMVDINHDGWLDLYVCNAGYIDGKAPKNQLFINNHDLTFTDSATAYGLDNLGGYCTHTAFFDYDLDGDLDAFIINNSFIPVNTLNYANKRDLQAKEWPVADFLKGGGDRFLRNDNGKFVDVGAEIGIHGSLISFGLGVTVGDVNGDKYLDVYVSNDFFERDYLYINQQNGTFKDELEEWMGHTSLASMGADFGDINNDGYPDIFTTDMLPDDDVRLKTTSMFDNFDVYRYKVQQGFYNQFMQNTLQLNNRNGKFMDIAYYSGVAASDWSWGGLLFDMDNDGLNDLFVCNGINHDVTNQDFIDFFANDIIQNMALTGKKEEIESIISKMPANPIPNKAFKNLGNLKFADAGNSLGFKQNSCSNGAAYADLDNDGDLDLVINNANEKAFVYRNNTRETQNNNYIGLVLKGKGQNLFAVGSSIKVYSGSNIFSRELMPSRGFQSSVDYKIIIGLGKMLADSMVIIWPDKSETIMINPPVNKVSVIQQPKEKIFTPATEIANQQLLLEERKQFFDKHSENDYTDFYAERNIPEMLSTEGPKAACGDVNGDGLDDVYIGGAAGHAGQLYLQTNSGFVKTRQQAFEPFASSEDVATLFFDADNDQDLDLFVGSGGNNVPPRDGKLNHRLYLNSGKGNFTVSGNAFPANDMNIAVVAANDFDGDGYIDLFVGSRSVPFSYGAIPTSYLFKNNGKGQFTNVATGINAVIANAGMVTGALWTDVSGDSKKELVITGEWMPTKIFSYNGRQFNEIKTSLKTFSGMWQTVASCDINNDGKQDLVLGNIGENFYLHPDTANPVKMWINDFDRNGTIDKVITRTIGKKDVPVFLKKDMTDQIPGLKKQNLNYENYAQKSIQELFASDILSGSDQMIFNYASSCIAINNGNGDFSIQRLPDYLQFSSVNAILCTDLNLDGKIDVVAGGNKFGFLPQFSRLDASFGHVLINKGNVMFDEIEASKSGLEIRGQIRDIKNLQAKDKQRLLFLQNNELPKLYQVNELGVPLK